MNTITICLFLSFFLSFISPTLTNQEDSANDKDNLIALDKAKTENATDANLSFESVLEKVKDPIDYEVEIEEHEYPEETDDDEMPNDWSVLESENESLNEKGNHSNEYIKENEDENKEGFDEESPESETEKPHTSKPKKKTSVKKMNDDKSRWKHKKHGKISKKKGSISQVKRYWKKNCCIRGKRIGVSRSTYLSDNLFQECRERTRNLPLRLSKSYSCRWIFWRCCEDKALRRFYVHFNTYSYHNSTCNN